jgi:hypothetical protein
MNFPTSARSKPVVHVVAGVPNSFQMRVLETP